MKEYIKAWKELSGIAFRVRNLSEHFKDRNYLISMKLENIASEILHVQRKLEGLILWGKD